MTGLWAEFRSRNLRNTMQKSAQVVVRYDTSIFVLYIIIYSEFEGVPTVEVSNHRKASVSVLGLIYICRYMYFASAEVPE
jgi:hypothetical protein